MNTTLHITFAALAERYEAFFIDQFGVLRDDDGAYDGANAALGHLKALRKTVVLLSNSGRSGEYNGERLVKLGFDRSNFDHFLTSGDVAHRILAHETDKRIPLSRCLTISRGGATAILPIGLDSKARRMRHAPTSSSSLEVRRRGFRFRPIAVN